MKKTLIALAAAATLAIGFSATAKADPHFGIRLGFGGPGFGFAVTDGYGFGPSYAPGYYSPAGYGYGYGYGHRRWHRGGCVTRWVGHRYPHPVRMCY